MARQTKAELADEVALLERSLYALEHTLNAQNERVATARPIIEAMAHLALADSDGGWARCVVCRRTALARALYVEGVPRFPHREDCAVLLAQQWLERTRE